MLRREDDMKKNRGTTSRTRRGQQFDEYFLAVGKKIRGEACPPGWKTIYLNVRENKTLEIPAGASILGAYWGNPRNFGQGKDVTQDIIMSVRRKGQQAFPASTEIFGDPWFGSKKNLIVKVAVKSDAALPQAQTTPKFDSYFECHGEVCDRTVDYTVSYLEVSEYDRMTIPKNALLLGAYWGDPDAFKRGKDVTATVIEMLRENNQYSFEASTEWFGDPWFGSRKHLICKIAVPKPKVVKQPVIATRPVITKPSVPRRPVQGQGVAPDVLNVLRKAKVSSDKFRCFYKINMNRLKNMSEADLGMYCGLVIGERKRVKRVLRGGVVVTPQKTSNWTKAFRGKVSTVGSSISALAKAASRRAKMRRDQMEAVKKLFVSVKAVKHFDKKGCGVKAKLEIFGVPQGYVGFGQRHTPGNLMAVPVRSIPTGVARAPVAYCRGYEAAWQHRKTKTKFFKKRRRWYCAWKPIPPPGYVAMGCVLKFGTKDSNPPSWQTLCVREDLTKATGPGRAVWKDHKSGAKTHVTLGVCQGMSLLTIINATKRGVGPTNFRKWAPGLKK